MHLTTHEKRTKNTKSGTITAHITLGDTNVRWHCRRNGEEDQLSPFVFGRGEEFLDSHAKDGDNREFCLEYLRNTKKIVMNTFFQKTPSAKVTYKGMGIADKEQPFTPDRFAELDQCLINQKWRNSITNVESETGIYVNSDHFPVTITCEMKLEAKQKREDKGASWTGGNTKGK